MSQTKSATNETSDQQLLADFIAHTDADAFGVIVRRYDNMVKGVCRRIVNRPHDVDDAFQATFLVLAKDARRIKRPEALSSWLYGVACRVSLRLVRERQRRKEEGFEDQAMETDDSVSLLSERYDARVLDEELNRLPERYRAPMVLHYFIGKSNSQIAEHLGMSVGTVDGRLKRGRATLRVRLAKRGVTMSVLAGLLSSATTAEASAPALIDQTVNAAIDYATGGTPSALFCSTQAIELAGKELFVMSLAKPMMFAAGIFLATAVGVSAFAMQKGTGEAATAGNADLQTVDSDPFGSENSSGASTAGEVQFNTATPNKVAAKPVAAKPQVKPKAPGDLFVATTQTKAAEQIDNALEESIEPFDFDQNTLQDLVDVVEDQHKVQIIIDSRALEREGLSPEDFEITANLKEISLRSALKIMLQPHELTTVVKNEVLYVTTQDAAAEYKETRVYLVSEFLDPFDLESSMQELIRTLQSNSGGYWLDTDGDGGTIQPVRSSRLVVTQTYEVHKAIHDLLDQLRQANIADPVQPGSASQRPARSTSTSTAYQQPVQPTVGVHVATVAGVPLTDRVLRNDAVLQPASATGKSAQWIRERLRISADATGMTISLAGVSNTDAKPILDSISKTYQQLAQDYAAKQSLFGRPNQGGNGSGGAFGGSGGIGGSSMGGGGGGFF